MLENYLPLVVAQQLDSAIGLVFTAIGRQWREFAANLVLVVVFVVDVRHAVREE